jgi:hypothetical protein
MSVVLLESLPKNWSAWSGLKLFQNEEWVAERIIAKHGLNTKQIPNAKKQAKQINYCLVQAKEYWDAAYSASSATAHLQLYYCCMSLALAEILWKGDGGQSLDKLREKAGHHGLNFSWSERTLSVSDLSKLTIRPNVSKGNRSGTFETWHHVARESILVGTTTNNLTQMKTIEPLFYPGNQRLPVLPETGITLDAIYSSLPRMNNALHNIGGKSRNVRAILTKIIIAPQIPGMDETNIYGVNVLSGDGQSITELMSQITIKPQSIPDTQINEFSNRFDFTQHIHLNKHVCIGGIQLPDGISMSAGVVYFKPFLPWLNEFGAIYVGSYLLGMLSRYYPDIWMKATNDHSSFNFLADCFFDFSLHRAPLLCLSALEGCAYVTDDVGINV